nr:hypothetical protein [Mediterraneibacter glycyrrhizinilyticus]
MRKFTGYFQKEKEQSLLRQQLQYQESHYQHLIRSAEQIQKIRHDMKNHLQTLSILYDENKTGELKEYLRQTYELLDHIPLSHMATGNTIPSYGESMCICNKSPLWDRNEKCGRDSEEILRYSAHRSKRRKIYN